MTVSVRRIGSDPPVRRTAVPRRTAARARRATVSSHPTAVTRQQSPDSLGAPAGRPPRQVAAARRRRTAAEPPSGSAAGPPRPPPSGRRASAAAADADHERSTNDLARRSPGRLSQAAFVSTLRKRTNALRPSVTAIGAAPGRGVPNRTAMTVSVRHIPRPAAAPRPFVDQRTTTGDHRATALPQQHFAASSAPSMRPPPVGRTGAAVSDAASRRHPQRPACRPGCRT